MFPGVTKSGTPVNLLEQLREPEAFFLWPTIVSHYFDLAVWYMHWTSQGPRVSDIIRAHI